MVGCHEIWPLIYLLSYLKNSGKNKKEKQTKSKKTKETRVPVSNKK